MTHEPMRPAFPSNNAIDVFARPDREDVVARIEVTGAQIGDPYRERKLSFVDRVRKRRDILKISNVKEHLRSLRNITRSRIALRELAGQVSSHESANTALQLQVQSLQLETKRLSSLNQELQLNLDAQRNMLLRLERASEESTNTMTRELVRLNGMVGAHRRAYVEISKQLASAPPADQNEASTPAHIPDLFLETFYREFEDRYRGSREEILLRLRPYLAHLTFLKERNQKSLRIVDLGCGRGEWLEVLREGGFPALGVDINEAQAEAARELDLEIEIDDIIAWLSRQKDRSIDLLSAFHVIEHLEFPVLLQLFREAVRVIKPGGGLLVETPNPESLIVGAYKFWLDPTHVRPYPPELITQLLESLSFERIEVLRLHPDGRNMDYQKQHGLAAPIADLIAGPLDYSVLCRRP
jgi:O-antigen chain-terminating methyltransferase